MKKKSVKKIGDIFSIFLMQDSQALQDKQNGKKSRKSDKK